MMKRSGDSSSMNNDATLYSFASILMMIALIMPMSLYSSINKIHSQALTGGDQPYLLEQARQIGVRDYAAYGKEK